MMKRNPVMHPIECETVTVVMSPTNAKAGTTDYPYGKGNGAYPECAYPPNMDDKRQTRTYDRHTTDTLQSAGEHMDEMNDRLNGMGYDINRCESHKINTNDYTCIFDAVVQITIQQRTNGIGVQMWLCDDCFQQINAQWKAMNNIE